MCFLFRPYTLCDLVAGYFKALNEQEFEYYKNQERDMVIYIPLFCLLKISESVKSISHLLLEPFH